MLSMEGSSEKRWPQDQSALPWFDRVDAADLLAQKRRAGEVNEDQFQLLRKWIEDGYFIIPDLVSKEEIAAFRAKVSEIWTTETPYDGLNISDVVIGGTTRIHTPHAEILKLSRTERADAERLSNWRIGGLHLVCEEADRLFSSRRARELCDMVFGRPSVPRYSLTFQKGSQQQLHQDTPVFHVFPRNNLIGVWIACEDIKKESGPLVYCPKSHREPLFPEFDNYPQTNRRTCDAPTSARYDAYVRELAQRYESRLFLPKAGEALFWHGQLIHGGHAIEDRNTTRLSFVVHFMAEGTDMANQVHGPFNW
jgi:ectoine hydroxylase-related dioxygenase (phytanoyl-CoA dioxygenase family)